MAAMAVVVAAPSVNQPGGSGAAVEEVLVEALVAQPADEALDQAGLHWLAGNDVVPLDPAVPARGEDRMGGQRGALGAVVQHRLQRIAVQRPGSEAQRAGIGAGGETGRAGEGVDAHGRPATADRPVARDAG